MYRRSTHVRLDLLNDAQRIGTAPMCNPTLSDCQKQGAVMMGNCFVPGVNTTVAGPCRSDNCDIYGYHAFCTKTVYPESMTATWMSQSSQFISTKPLNAIPMVASHDTATYAILNPSFGSVAFAALLAVILVPITSMLSSLLALLPVLEPLILVLEAGLEIMIATTLPVYEGDVVPHFGPDAQSSFRDIVSNFATCGNTASSPILKNTLNSICSSLDKAVLERVVKGVVGVWARAQSADIQTQLSAGARYLDFRLCVDNQEGAIPDANLNFASHCKFTHSLICDITATELFTHIHDWVVANNAHGEVIVMDFNDMFQLTYGDDEAGNFMYVSSRVRDQFQLELLTLLDTLFGTALSPAVVPPTTTYANFTQQGYQFFVCFENKNNFVTKWQPKFPWVRNRGDIIADTWRATRTNPIDTYNDNIATINDPGWRQNAIGKFTIVTGNGGEGGNVTFRTYGEEELNGAIGGDGTNILLGLLHPSELSGPNGLEQLSMRYTPVFVAGMLPAPYTMAGDLPPLPSPPDGFNFVKTDHFQKFNTSTLLIAWNRGELAQYGGKAIPTTNDSQCHCATKTISGKSVFDCGACYTDPAGYDDTTCIGESLECYSTTAPQCMSNADCYFDGAQCQSHTGGGSSCKFDVATATCHCHNPHIPTGQSCPDRVDAQCLNGTCAQFPKDNYVCCPSGHELTPGGAVSDYCSNLNAGDSCAYNVQCNSGSCGRIGDSSAPLQCCPGGVVTKGIYDYCDHATPTGTACDADAQCVSGACGRMGDSGWGTVCCPGANKTVVGKDYCVGINLPSGSPCRSDDQCASGNCKGNGYGVSDGNCS